MAHNTPPGPLSILFGLLPGTAFLIFLASSYELFSLTFLDVQMIVVGAIAFIAFWQLMKVTFWKPYIALFEEREALTTGAEGSAAEQINEAKRLAEQYEQSVSSARIDAMQSKLEKIGSASKQASDILTVAENKSKDEIVAARADVQQSLEPLKKQLFESAESMVEDTVNALKQPPQNSTQISQ